MSCALPAAPVVAVSTVAPLESVAVTLTPAPAPAIVTEIVDAAGWVAGGFAPADEGLLAEEGVVPDGTVVTEACGLVVEVGLVVVVGEAAGVEDGLSVTDETAGTAIAVDEVPEGDDAVTT